MDALTELTNELRETLSTVKDGSKIEEIIFEHIRSAEERNYILPDFPMGSDWFNVKEPLTTSELNDKIVILDFFTYCCINCLHVIPHLREVENKYPVSDGLVVVSVDLIGVHSAKFENEKDSANVLSAIKRYNISHPVCNDKECVLWNKLNISCWPTILIAGPGNKILFSILGEGCKEDMMLYIEMLKKFYKTRISPKELPIIQSCNIVKSSVLSFPAKITHWQGKFAISDCGKHRILICNKDGDVQFAIGGKEPGFQDGNFHEAKFNSPQGLAFYDANMLYIADTENHAIRLVNLETETVTTVAGTGAQGTDYSGGRCGRDQEISSPWDVCIVPCSDVDVANEKPKPLDGPAVRLDNLSSCPLPPPMPSGPPAPPPPPPPVPPRSPGLPATSSPVKNTCLSRVLLIAAAGTHQIWAYFIEAGVWWKGKRFEKNTCLAIVGTGKEENRNNRFPHLASFAQPSGLAYSPDLKAVFVADSESSTIRKLSTRNGSVTHVVGGSRAPDDLFSYGDVDGAGYQAKLQHPIGLAWNSKRRELLVCDTYNHKVKTIRPGVESCESLRVRGEDFNEPSGCCIDESGDFAYVCDTNNGEIKVVNLNDNTATKLQVREASHGDVSNEPGTHWQVLHQLDSSGGVLKLNVEFAPADAHGRWMLNLKEEDRVRVDANKGNLSGNVLHLVMEFPPSENDSVFSVSFQLMFCGKSACNVRKEKLEVTLRRVKGADAMTTCNVSRNLV